jgi:hypothetical protein
MMISMLETRSLDPLMPLRPATSLDGEDHRRLTMFVASEHTRPGKVNVLLISSGSVASIKIPLIVEALLEVRSFQTLDNELTFSFDILS